MVVDSDHRSELKRTAFLDACNSVLRKMYKLQSLRRHRSFFRIRYFPKTDNGGEAEAVIHHCAGKLLTRITPPPPPFV